MSLSSPMASATIQSAALGGIANVLAQLITAYRTGGEVTIDWIPVFQFLLFNLIATPPNFMWKKNPKDPKAQPKLSIRNTAIKFILDQTVGAAINTLLFSTYTHAIRSAIQPVPVVTNLFKAVNYWTKPGAVDLSKVDWDLVWEASKAEFVPFVVAGWKLWPAVSLVNFAAVKTVEGRNLVGALAGVVWGIYMSLVAAQ